MFSFTIGHLLDCIVLAAIYLFVLLPKWKRKGGSTLFIRTAMYVYLSFVLFFTMMPVITALPFVFDHPYAFNLTPFDDYVNGRGDVVRQIALNIIMTVPFGILFPLTRRRSRRKWIITALATFLLSLSIEILQPLVNSYRSFDITDIITNTIGGMLGYLGFVILRPLIEKKRRNEYRFNPKEVTAHEAVRERVVPEREKRIYPEVFQKRVEKPVRRNKTYCDR